MRHWKGSIGGGRTFALNIAGPSLMPSTTYGSLSNVRHHFKQRARNSPCVPMVWHKNPKWEEFFWGYRGRACILPFLNLVLQGQRSEVSEYLNEVRNWLQIKIVKWCGPQLKFNSMHSDGIHYYILVKIFNARITGMEAEEIQRDCLRFVADKLSIAGDQKGWNLLLPWLLPNCTLYIDRVLFI